MPRSEPETTAARTPGRRPRPFDRRRRARRRQALVSWVGRRSARHSEARQAIASGFRVVLVTGAAGLGKTRLVTEAARARSEDATVLSARAYRWGATSSFGMWVEALDRHLRILGDGERRELCGPFLQDLAGFLGAVQGLEGPVDPWPSRTRVLETLVGLFDRMSRRNPVVVVLDDVHLADSSSLEALRVLGRRLNNRPGRSTAPATPPTAGTSPTRRSETPVTEA